MNNFNLDAVLKAAKTPQGSAEDWNDIPCEVLAELRRVSAPERVATRQSLRLAWGIGLAMACLAIAFSIGYWRGQASSPDVLQNAKVIRETLAMFPNRVRAIVQDERGLSLVLSDSDDVPASPPIYVRICDGKQCSSLVTFSGQEIQIAGQKVTVLADAHGGIILTGNEFVWSNTEQTYAGNHLKIEAKNLGTAAM